MNAYLQKEQTPSQKDNTGIPAQMKNKFERSSGFSFDDVRVHYNSEKPAQLHAHAYTQGNEVYVAPGQEKHLPHELGHVVQQKSNAVTPTGEISGMPLNDDEAMESGADRLAEEAESFGEPGEVPLQAKAKDGVVQRFSTTDFYNLSTGISALAGIGGAIYGFYKNSKEKYVSQIENYTEKAEDACAEAEASYYEMLNTDDAAEKTKKAIETKKYATKAKQSAQTACDKYVVKSGMKSSDNANTAIRKSHRIKRKARKYINEANRFIANRGVNAPHNQLEGEQLPEVQVLEARAPEVQEPVVPAAGVQEPVVPAAGAQEPVVPAPRTPEPETPEEETPDHQEEHDDEEHHEGH